MLSVLITGANRGLGLEFIRQLLNSSKPPQHLFACCRSPENAQDLQSIASSNSTVTVLKLDVKDIRTYQEAVKIVEGAVGEAGLNVLINNAGIGSRNNTENTTAEDMTEVHTVNVIGPLGVTQAFLPVLKQAAKFTNSSSETMCMQTAAVVNISTIMGCISLNKSGESLAYKTSKAAVNMLTNCMSHDFAPYEILAVAMHPGWVQTDMGGKDKAPLTPEESIRGMLNTSANSKEGKLLGNVMSTAAKSYRGECYVACMTC